MRAGPELDAGVLAMSHLGYTLDSVCLGLSLCGLSAFKLFPFRKNWVILIVWAFMSLQEAPKLRKRPLPLSWILLMYFQPLQGKNHNIRAHGFTEGHHALRKSPRSWASLACGGRGSCTTAVADMPGAEAMLQPNTSRVRGLGSWPWLQFAEQRRPRWHELASPSLLECPVCSLRLYFSPVISEGKKLPSSFWRLPRPVCSAAPPCPSRPHFCSELCSFLYLESFYPLPILPGGEGMGWDGVKATASG